ncbi:MAG TPA: DUF4139 domain-containing protein [bacterium]
MKRRIHFLSAFLLACTTVSAPHAEVSLTIYQRDLVLVRDVRTVDLQRGENTIVFDGVAPGIHQTTLRITPLQGASGVKTIEQNYEYDVVNEDRVWSKFLGKPFEFTKDDSLYKGALRNFDEDFIYLEPEGKPGSIALIGRSGIKDAVFDVIPEGLALRPRIRWRASSDGARSDVRVEISYLSKGLTWQAEYAAQLINNDRLRLEGNLTLSNSLDMDFQDARIELMAGNPHRTGDARQLSDEEAFESGQAAAKETGEKFYEYRRYEVPGQTSLHASQTKGIPLIGPVDVAAQRSFFFDGSSGAEEVQVRLLFDNSKASGLGIALPEGNLLLYQADSDEQTHFLGEDQLQASAPGDKVELVMGRAFDLRVDRKRMDHQRIARNRTLDTVEITLSSSRDQASQIVVRERLYGYWEIVEAKWGDQPISYRIEDANRIEFDINLASGAAQTLRYVVEYGY